jgi:MSHA biogenesis protein MshK
MKPLLRACLACGFWAYASAPSALAQELTDPMRPPNVSGVASAAGEDVEAPRQLQSVLLSRGRKIAVINGDVVALGGRIGDGIVRKITEAEVVLDFPDHTETLKLLGGVERKAVGGRPTKGGH